MMTMSNEQRAESTEIQYPWTKGFDDGFDIAYWNDERNLSQSETAARFLLNARKARVLFHEDFSGELEYVDYMAGSRAFRETQGESYV